MSESTRPNLERLRRFHRDLERGDWGEEVRQRVLARRDVGDGLGEHSARAFFAAATGTPVEQRIYGRMYPMVRALVLTYCAVLPSDPELAQEVVSFGLEGAPEQTQVDRMQRAIEKLHERSHAYEASNRRMTPTQQWRRENFGVMEVLLQAHHELLGKMSGYMVLAWRQAHGDSVKRNALSNSYGALVNQLSDYCASKGLHLIQPWCNFANAGLRNAIAHSELCMDSDTYDVSYFDRRGTEVVMGLESFVLDHVSPAASFIENAAVAGHIAHAMTHGAAWLLDVIPNELLSSATDTLYSFAEANRPAQV